MRIFVNMTSQDVQGYPPSGSSNQEQQFKPVFNAEEMRVLRECNIESFYYRCVPIAAAFTTAAFFAMKKGVVRTSERFGYTPKMLGAAFVGYFVGKLSYQNACAEKLMRLPNSPIGEALRKRKGRMGFQESVAMEPGFSVAAPSSDLSSGDFVPQHTQPMFDDHKPDFHNEGLDDYERGVTDSLNPYTSTPQELTSYEELRRQNREEYVNRMAERYRRPLSDAPLDSGLSNFPPSDPPMSSPPAPSSRSSPPRVVKRNQYGDEIIE